MTPGQRIKQLRTLKNIEQQTLATKIDLATSKMIVKWETDQGLPNGRNLKKLATFFGVSVDYILGLDDLRSD